MQPKSFDRVAACYDATRAMPRAASAAVAAGIAGALRTVAPDPWLLEVGIGTGRIAVPLAEAGVRVGGVDIAAAMLARLRAKRADIPALRAEATRLPFRAAAFDGALFVHLLHLLADAAAALRAAHAVVRPGGVLLYGRTDHAESPRRRVLAELRELVRDLAGIDLGPRRWNAAADEAFARHARDTGAELCETVLARWSERATGRQLLRGIEHRLYSSTWAIPDAVMPELLRRLTPRAEALLGGLDQPIDSDVAFTLLTARLPGLGVAQ